MPWLTAHLTDFLYRIDFNNALFYKAVAAIAAQPAIWTIISRNEYHNHTLTRFFNSKELAIGAMAAIIFVGGRIRDGLFYKAIEAQASWPLLQHSLVKYSAWALFGWGAILVLSSSYKLGWKNTFMGDYFGIYLDGPVTTFPYTVCADPMYLGSTLMFLGAALNRASPAGLLLTAFVYTSYRVTAKIEEPFTAKIYADKIKRERRSN